MIIPREGGYLVRFYVDLGEVDPHDRAAVRNMQPEDVIAVTPTACCIRTRSR